MQHELRTVAIEADAKSEEPPTDAAAFAHWLEQAPSSADPLFFAVIDRATERAKGRQSLMRIDSANGVIEVGRILWGPAIARTRVATEALFLLARKSSANPGPRSKDVPSWSISTTRRRRRRSWKMTAG